MTIRTRLGSAALGMVAVALMGGFPLVAQEPAGSKPSDPPAKKKQDPSRRVPAYFGQIGLTPEQRASIYSAQAKHHEKIDALEKQIATEKAEMLSECEGVLNETQKKLLETLRKAATEPAKTALPAKPAETPRKAG